MYYTNKTRSEMSAYNVPKQFWGDALESACYVYNRTHVVPSRLPCTPFEAVYGEVPDVSELVPFFAPGVYHVTDEERRKKGGPYMAKAEAVRHLGYSTVSKNTYRVLSVKTRRISERTDCYWNEDLQEKINDKSDSKLQEVLADMISRYLY